MRDLMISLNKYDIPNRWYNIAADLPHPVPPPLHPGTTQPLSAKELAAIFPDPLIEQEMSVQRWIDIPDEILELYALWRPTPLIRARRLELYLNTPAKIFYKDESGSPAGSHKVNTAVAQAYYNKKFGTERLATETGAGQWGSALAFAAHFFGLQCIVYMVKVSYAQKPYRRSLMQLWNATVHASPSQQTEYGRGLLAADPDCPGSLGIAISEAIADTVTHAKTKYCLGSVLNHVMLHQTVIGLEAKRQLEHIWEEPDVLIGCVGGGSNFAGLVFPFIFDDKLRKKTRYIAVEPSACPTLTRGPYRYDFGDTAKMTPLIKMHTLGHDFIPPGIHAGGLRYHGMAPLISAAHQEKLIEARSYPQKAVFEAAVTLARVEGRVPAPETAHAVRAAIDEAIRCREERKAETIVFNFSGHGFFDLSSYDKYLQEQMEDYAYPQEQIDAALARLPVVESQTEKK